MKETEKISACPHLASILVGSEVEGRETDKRESKL